jgi:hypothetical protein
MRHCLLSFCALLGLTAQHFAHAENSPAPALLKPNFGMTLAAAPGEAWVPVLVLTDQTDAAQGAPTLMGLARVSDIQDGLPYSVNLYRIGANFPVAPDVGLSAELFGASGGLSLTPVCRAGTYGPNCEPLSSTLSDRQQSAGTLRIGTTLYFDKSQVSLGLKSTQADYAQILNPYLPWPGAGAIQGVEVSGRTRSRLGQFGLGVGLSESSVQNQEFRLGEVKFDWVRGAFGTSLSTQIMDFPGARSVFGSVDLGVTWRTPWQGVLSVGAKAPVGSTRPRLGPNLRPLLGEERDFEDRVPYVRYEQDL